MPFNYVDIILFGALGIMAGRGFLRGFIREVAGVIALVIGLLLAKIFAPQLAADLAPRMGQGATVVAWIVLVMGGMMAVGVASAVIKRLVTTAHAGWLDHLLGLLVGAAKGVLLAALLSYAMLWAMPNSVQLKDSLALPPLMDFVSEILGSLNMGVSWL